jgi:hypothetical protein
MNGTQRVIAVKTVLERTGIQIKAGTAGIAKVMLKDMVIVDWEGQRQSMVVSREAVRLGGDRIVIKSENPDWGYWARGGWASQKPRLFPSLKAAKAVMTKQKLAGTIETISEEEATKLGGWDA